MIHLLNGCTSTHWRFQNVKFRFLLCLGKALRESWQRQDQHTPFDVLQIKSPNIFYQILSEGQQEISIGWFLTSKYYASWIRSRWIVTVVTVSPVVPTSRPSACQSRSERTFQNNCPHGNFYSLGWGVFEERLQSTEKIDVLRNHLKLLISSNALEMLDSWMEYKAKRNSYK